MESFIRSAALEKLLECHHDLTEDQLLKALRCGLNDPDFLISEKAWRFAQNHRLIGKLKPEAADLVARLKKSDDPYARGLAQEITPPDPLLTRGG